MHLPGHTIRRLVAGLAVLSSRPTTCPVSPARTRPLRSSFCLTRTASRRNAGAREKSPWPTRGGKRCWIFRKLPRVIRCRGGVRRLWAKRVSPVSLPLPSHWRRLWLLAESTGPKPSTAFCTGAHFVLADGSTRSLAELPLVYEGVDHGQLVKTAATAERPEAFSATGGWAIAVDIPEGAERFEATPGTANGAADAAAVRFRITDCPSHLGWWPDVAWPAIGERFPDVCRQFVERCGDISLASPDWKTWAPKIHAAIGTMTEELGPVRVRAPQPATDAPIAELLDDFARLVSLKQAETQAIDRLWAVDSRLAELLDFPKFGFEDIRERLDYIADNKLTSEADLASQRGVFKQCAAELDQAVMVAAVDDDSDAFSLIPETTGRLEQLSEWIDLQRGWPTYGGERAPKLPLAREVRRGEFLHRMASPADGPAVTSVAAAGGGKLRRRTSAQCRCNVRSRIPYRDRPKMCGLRFLGVGCNCVSRCGLGPPTLAIYNRRPSPPCADDRVWLRVCRLR